MIRILLILLIFSFPIQAAEQQKPVKKPLIDPKLCARLQVEYQQPPGVEYEPGVDVRGKPVAPADLSTPPEIGLPESYSFDITIDVMEYAGITAPTGVEGQLNVGTITFEKGKIKFNDQPLGNQQEAALKELCEG